MTTAGRPRDPRIDAALRSAVQDLLVADGYLGLSVQAVAREAGVSVAAIYRRFPGKRELVEWALFPSQQWIEPAYTGVLIDDLTTLVGVLVGWLSTPATRAAVPGLLGEYVRDSDRYTALLEATVVPVRASLEGLLERGGAKDDVPLDALLDVLLGAALLESLVTDGKDVLGVSRRIAEIAWRASR
jgi:AcrR family transcriptional regulator